MYLTANKINYSTNFKLLHKFILSYGIFQTMKWVFQLFFPRTLFETFEMSRDFKLKQNMILNATKYKLYRYLNDNCCLPSSNP